MHFLSQEEVIYKLPDWSTSTAVIWLNTIQVLDDNAYLPV